jgi:hypothetical protein
MEGILEGIAAFWASLPRPLQAAIILAAGWSAALLARLLISRLLAALKFDRLSERTGFKEFLRKGGVEFSASKLAGVTAYWVILVLSLILSALSLDERILGEFGSRAAEKLPAFFSAGLVMAVGLVLTGFLAKFVSTIARNAGFPNAGLLARAIKWAGFLLTLSISLDQLGVGGNLIGPVFLILLGALALGAALAFGLGCKDMAREAMERFIRAMMERSREGGGEDMEG